ncbi:phage tail protein I [Chromobacterium sp. Panama]|uniref:phage tail protein I n=1 Tax=Chromobacterium sp. Panama TaxID=2161826 RepID=UPI0018EEB811|nr:phage tail protein I [Chromobacterium sp. Panama]
MSAAATGSGTVPNMLAKDERFGQLAQLTTRLGDADLSTLLVYLVDQVDAGWLPALAEQFHVAGDEGWRLSQGERQRRELIKQSIHLHRSKGTRWSLQQVLATLALSGQISEWFEYGGKPYHFKIQIDLAARGIDAATLAALEAMINEYKNARSVLERLALVLSNRSAVPVLALATQAGELATVLPFQPVSLEQRASLNAALALDSVETATVYPFQTTALRQQAPVTLGLAHASVETVTLYPAA